MSTYSELDSVLGDGDRGDQDRGPLWNWQFSGIHINQKIRWVIN